MVIDPGGESKTILREIEKTEGGVKYVTSTHPHFDHNLKEKKIAKETGGKILESLKEGEEIKIGESKIRVLKMSGHTKEDNCFLGNSFIISGDILFPGGHGRTDLPGGSKKEMERTLKRLKKELSDSTVVYPGHGEPFTMKEWKASFPEG